ncbi:hypothetical protein AYO49_05615 [Verrucomicrobiaceae bacterium SCGC AG-212-N21]|nr:hypothetical protein AYO49_05615 [Verrucomicrobiaceae bacterium SCGC AG-212-N21]
MISATAILMRVLFINKFIPPDPAPTAVLVDAVARKVRENGGHISFAGSHAGYRQQRVSGWRRWWREGWGNARLLWRGLTGPRPDAIVCLTDPPGSLVVGALIARLRRAKLIHWAMDVYPEIAVALGELTPAGPVDRAVRSAMHWAYRQCAAIACLDDDMLEILNLRNDPRAFVSTPWPAPGLSAPEFPPTSNPTRLRWLYSGNLGRAHDYATLLRAQRRLEDADAPFDLVFQGGGPAREAAMRMAAVLRLEHCHWLDYAPEEKLLESMLAAHVLIATQKPETRGLLWPSKLAPMLALPRPITWVGPIDGAIAAKIRESGPQHAIFAPGDDESLARWLMDSRHDLARHASFSAQAVNDRLAQAREESLATWLVRLESVAPRSET